ncbi:nitroreductase family protein [Pectinatus brassicae]|uniref:Nitroreductase n=1 Tax=Pectinatus brassicae TaxID=862415 RepID=A0A840UG41_9FIRM|nr:nitroreductase family protein [Pectinatus brassicae]MBB5336076.1 nitroreductase [Pectinatus brassicae]
MKEIFTRTSVRTYKEEKIEKDKLTLLLKAAMAAPSAGNQQPWEFCVVTNVHLLEKLSQSSPYAGCVKNAPAAIIACYNKNRLNMPECADIDMSAAVENILLAAEAIELGAVWLGIAPLRERMDKVNKILSLPKELETFAIIPIGYPQNKQPQQNRFDEKRIYYKD